MAFAITANVHVERDKYNVIRHIRHLQEPYTSKSARFASAVVVPTPQMLISQYGLDVGDHLPDRCIAADRSCLQPVKIND